MEMKLHLQRFKSMAITPADVDDLSLNAIAVKRIKLIGKIKADRTVVLATVKIGIWQSPTAK